MKRRLFIKRTLVSTTLIVPASPLLRSISQFSPVNHVRPGDPDWPSESAWNSLNKQVNGRLFRPESPFKACAISPDNIKCKEALKQVRNPYFLGDEPALTQTSGYLQAWKSSPSVYAVAAQTTEDVVATVNFARKHKLKLVVKGGGHSYQGTSNAPDSLLLWTRHMNHIELKNNFIAKDCEKLDAPQEAVTIEAGAIWMQAYDAVVTKAGKYVQGGGCSTVGVAGLIQSGGFGSFSKNYGLAAASLLEAEIVTANGKVLIVNKCCHPDLFWALKGGGGGSFGIITRLTLKTHKLPEFFGGVFGAVKANSDEAYKKLIAYFMAYYKENLFNPHWGEQWRFVPNNTVYISMVFQGLNQQQVTEAWKPLQDWVSAHHNDYEWTQPISVATLPAQHLWDVDYINQHAPGFLEQDGREGSPKINSYWKNDGNEAGQFLYGYHSAWLPDNLLEKENQEKLVNALFAASRHWDVSLHFNKGLAGAPKEHIEAAKNTATNPAVCSAFALAIIAGQGAPSFDGMPDAEIDEAKASQQAREIANAMDALLQVVPNPGSYVSESNFFEKNWKQSFWGSNYERLSAVKKKYDPNNLFLIHHGIGNNN